MSTSAQINTNRSTQSLEKFEEQLNSLSNPLALLGRVLLSLMFILAGFDKLTGFEGTAAYIASVGLPAPHLLTVLTIVVEIGAGLALLVGFKPKWAALILAGFTLAASVIFHNYWAAAADQAYIQQLLFMKNISVAGGLLLVAALGGGQWGLSGSTKHQA
ncbi:MAG: DoxX family protein [Limnobacter sp.]|nr:DoxX family protein [Limnobacter sp.]